MGKAVGIHPATCLIALVAGTKLFGIWGRRDERFPTSGPPSMRPQNTRVTMHPTSGSPCAVSFTAHTHPAQLVHLTQATMMKGAGGTVATQGASLAGQADAHAHAAARRSRPWLEPLGRAGYAANGVVYGLVGILAAQAAIGAGGATTDTHGALVPILQAPEGRLLLDASASWVEPCAELA
jgi:hypothetical protein